MKIEHRYGNLADQLINDPILLDERDRFPRWERAPKQPPLRKIRFDWRDK